MSNKRNICSWNIKQKSKKKKNQFSKYQQKPLRYSNSLCTDHMPNTDEVLFHLKMIIVKKKKNN